jgi:hypothetical protein
MSKGKKIIMAENSAPLKPVDRLEITILVDNSIDVFSSQHG